MEPDAEKNIAQPPPPLHADDVDSSSTEHDSQLERNVSLAPSSTPSTIREDAYPPQGEKDVESTQAGSSAAPSAVKVPRGKRRGLFAQFCVLAEVEEPKQYPRGMKWLITFIIAMAAVAAPLGSSIILRERFLCHEVAGLNLPRCQRAIHLLSADIVF